MKAYDCREEYGWKNLIEFCSKYFDSYRVFNYRNILIYVYARVPESESYETYCIYYTYFQPGQLIFVRDESISEIKASMERMKEHKIFGSFAGTQVVREARSIEYPKWRTFRMLGE